MERRRAFDREFFMDEKFKTIVTGFPGKRDRSQLAPHSKLILELHRRGFVGAFQSEFQKSTQAFDESPAGLIPLFLKKFFALRNSAVK